MKYSDYKNQYDVYTEKRREQIELERPIHVEMYNLDALCRREYQIGMSEAADYHEPTPITVIVTPSDGRPTMRARGANPYEIYDWAALSVLQFTKIAEIRRVIEQWKLGEIDELPPSGDWISPAR